MYVFPSVSVDDQVWRLPLANHTALGLYELLLHSDPARLTEWLMLDPPLLLWSSCQLPDEASDWSLAEAGRYVAERLASWLAVASGREPAQPSCSKRWPDLIRRSLGTAALAARLVAAADPSDETVVQRAYWVGAAIESASWFSSCGPTVRQTDLARGRTPLPSWLAESITAARQGRGRCPVLSAVSAAHREIRKAGVSALDSLEGGQTVRADVEQSSQLWQEEVEPSDTVVSPGAAAWGGGSDVPGRCLILLAGKLKRLDELETSFERRLQEEKLSAMAELAYGASHEINNPLANISSRAQTLLREETHPERRRQLATIEAQAYRAFEMIADMMLFAKPPQPTRSRFPVGELLATVQKEFAEQANQQQTELCVADGEMAVELLADRVQLETALRAVVQNALEAVGQGGTVTLAFSQDQRFHWLTVSDTGPGLSPQAQVHLFDPFFSGREAGRGLGLGLSKVWAIVRQHGGQVMVDSPSGKGVAIGLGIPAPAGLVEP